MTRVTIKSLKDIITGQNITIDAQLQKLKTQSITLNRQALTIKSHSTTELSSIRILKERVATKDEVIVAHAAQIDSLTAQDEERSNYLKTIEERIVDQSSELAERREENRIDAATIKRLQDDVKELLRAQALWQSERKHFAELGGALEAKEEEIDRQNTIINSLTSQIDRMRLTLERASAHIHKLNQAVASPLDTQVAGSHYKKLGCYQPWEVSNAQLNMQELKGAMKHTVTSYLAREQHKNGIDDIRKAAHTMQIYLQMWDARDAQAKVPVPGMISTAATDLQAKLEKRDEATAKACIHEGPEGNTDVAPIKPGLTD